MWGSNKLRVATIKKTRDYVTWHLDMETTQRFNREVRGLGGKPNVAIEVLMKYWLEEKLPGLKAAKKYYGGKG
jgi:hypothetical protein